MSGSLYWGNDCSCLDKNIPRSIVYGSIITFAHNCIFIALTNSDHVSYKLFPCIISLVQYNEKAISLTLKHAKFILCKTHYSLHLNYTSFRCCIHCLLFQLPFQHYHFHIITFKAITTLASNLINVNMFL